MEDTAQTTRVELAPQMHGNDDSRAKSINDVIYKENHQMPTDATDQQRRDLEVYLLSL